MLTKGHLEKKNIIEVLGLSSLPSEAQQHLVDRAAEVIDMRCLEHILDLLNDGEKALFTTALENRDEHGIQKLFKKNGIDILDIIDGEVRAFKEEMSGQFA